MADEQDTHRLSAEQLERAVREQQQARAADEPEEVEQHQRRADKAEYLREKLEERVRSEQRDD
jgi:hypothetical protein